MQWHGFDIATCPKDFCTALALCTAALESSGAIFSEFRPPKDIDLLSIATGNIVYKICREMTQMNKNLMKHYETHNCQRM